MKKRTRNQIFEFVGAKPTNPRWSWCALSTNHRGAILTLWKDKMRDDERYRFFTGRADARARPGAVDMRRVLDTVMREQIPAFGLVCIASDPNSSPRSIKEVKHEFLIRLQIEREDGVTFGRYLSKVRLREVRQEISGPPAIEDDGLDDLEDAPIGNLIPDRAVTSGMRVVRNLEVRAYVLRNANGKCEYCGERGFQMTSGDFYLEAHHVILLSAEGEDTPANVIALCPKHHREAHFGSEAKALEERFLKCIGARKKKPNKAPEPTPPSVTPRASEGTSK